MRSSIVAITAFLLLQSMDAAGGIWLTVNHCETTLDTPTRKTQAEVHWAMAGRPSPWPGARWIEAPFLASLSAADVRQISAKDGAVGHLYFEHDSLYVVDGDVVLVRPREDGHPEGPYAFVLPAEHLSVFIDAGLVDDLDVNFYELKARLAKYLTLSDHTIRFLSGTLSDSFWEDNIYSGVISGWKHAYYQGQDVGVSLSWSRSKTKFELETDGSIILSHELIQWIEQQPSERAYIVTSISPAHIRVTVHDAEAYQSLLKAVVKMMQHQL